MKPRLRQYAVLWTAAVTHVRPRANAVLGWGIVLLTALGAVLALLQDDPRKALAVAWCTPFGLVLIAWSFQFMPGAAKLNTPASAQLVPAMRRRMAELAFGVWFLCLAGIAACPFADKATLAAVVLWISMLSLGSGLNAAGAATGTVLVFAAVILPPSAAVLPEWLQALAARPLFLVAELAALALAGALAAILMFPRAGERHWRMQARRNRWISMPPVDRTGGGGARRVAGQWYAAQLGRDCVRRKARGLLLHALGRGAGSAELRFGELLLFALGLAAIGLLVRLTESADAVQTLAGIGWIFASTILVVPMTQPGLSPRPMPSAAAEQSLLRLAPLLPGTAPAFNRLLARALLAQALGGWTLAALAAFLLTWLSGASGDTLALQACVSCLALPMMAAPLRDLSRRGSQLPLLPVLLPGSVLLCVAAGAALRAAFGLSLMPAAAAAALTLAAAATLRGWRLMERAPFAFPAGRMD